MAEPTNVNDFCRFCKVCMRKNNRLSHTKKIFEREGSSEQCIFLRLALLGLRLEPKDDKSFRICLKCVTQVKTLEESTATLKKWKLSEETTAPEPAATTTPNAARIEKRLRESPRTPRKDDKRARYHPPTPNRKSTDSAGRVTPVKGTRQSVVKVHVEYPHARPATLKCSSTAAGIVENIGKEKWSTAANLIMKHPALLLKIKDSVLTLLDNECKRLCHERDFMLFRCSPDDLTSFSFAKLKAELQRSAPFLDSLLSTVTKDSPLPTCVAASILLKGRHGKMPNAFAYYINSVLQYGGAKKSVFQRLCKLGISTSHAAAVRKQHSLAETCGDVLLKHKAAKELFLNSQPDSDGDVFRAIERLDLSEGASTSAAEGITEGMQGLAVQSLSPETTELMDFPSLMAAEDDQVLPSSVAEVLTPCSSDAESMTEDMELPDFTTLLAAADDHPHDDASPPEGQESTLHPPPSYSIIFDNLDFYMPTHHQSQDKSNKSIHWTHHMAVEDRVPTHHLSKEKPTMPVTTSAPEIIQHCLPDHKSQYYMRQEFIVLGARILTQHLAAFKDLSGVVADRGGPGGRALYLSQRQRIPGLPWF